MAPFSFERLFRAGALVAGQDSGKRERAPKVPAYKARLRLGSSLMRQRGQLLRGGIAAGNCRQGVILFRGFIPCAVDPVDIGQAAVRPRGVRLGGDGAAIQARGRGPFATARRRFRLLAKRPNHLSVVRRLPKH